MQIKTLPSLADLEASFEYRPDEGELYRKFSSGMGKKGALAGGVSQSGYRFALINGVSYQLHRIIWKMHFKEEPLLHIDHVDGDRLNNRVSNLRLATVSQNLCNAKLRSDSTTGIKGVYFSPKGYRLKPWRSVLMKDQKFIQVGRYRSKDEAIKALDLARQRLHGEFARAA